jgi:hypothetical protein
MTESMLLVICEGGWLEYHALARSGSCNRSLYAVCAKLLGPAVRIKSLRLYHQIKGRVEAQLKANVHVELDRVQQDRRYYFARYWAQPLGLGVRVLHFHIEESVAWKNEWLCHLRVWGGVGPRESKKYSPDAIRRFRRLSGLQKTTRRIFAEKFGRPLGINHRW